MIIIVPIEEAIFIGALSPVVGLVSDELELSVELLPDDDVSVELPELEEPEVESDEQPEPAEAEAELDELSEPAEAEAEPDKLSEPEEAEAESDELPESDEPEAEPEIVPEELPELEPDELELEGMSAFMYISFIPQGRTLSCINLNNNILCRLFIDRIRLNNNIIQAQVKVPS